MPNRRKLTDVTVHHMRELHAMRERLLATADRLTLTKLAKRFGVSYSTVHGVCHRKTYKDV